jgi:2-iminoacetate synthase ThiH
MKNKRIGRDSALTLYKTAGLLDLAGRRMRSGGPSSEGVVTFVVDRNINYTRLYQRMPLLRLL